MIFIVKAHLDAIMQVMKMVMMVYSPAAGRIQYQLQEGAVLKTGDLIATLQLDDPLSVTRAQPFPGSFREMGPPLVFSSTIEHRLTQALTAAHMIMAGALCKLDVRSAEVPSSGTVTPLVILSSHHHDIDLALHSIWVTAMHAA